MLYLGFFEKMKFQVRSNSEHGDKYHYNLEHDG